MFFILITQIQKLQCFCDLVFNDLCNMIEKMYSKIDLEYIRISSPTMTDELDVDNYNYITTEERLNVF